MARKTDKKTQIDKERKIKIKIALLTKGLKQKDIARELGISSAAVSMFINGKRTSKRFEEWIKTHLEINLE